MCVRLFLEGGTRIKWRVHKVFVTGCLLEELRKMKTSQLKGGIYLNDGRGEPLWPPTSPLPRKSRGSHPTLGPNFTNAGDNGRGEKFFARCLNSFGNNHLRNPNSFFRR